ncbi:ABC transporter substrate-binding protein (plasmid) [Agrobacterium leguminum]|uniref:Periplasmic component of amino acid ABC-type transporter/signal transduction system n=1 Tax=Agrobacterium deltaense NCPPB 1641 TaxID=1183425 RepID=A0A1S7U6R2_9HYPH|nr:MULTISPECIES: ABC transporter substrate-binding protein [Agrobacterium]WFS69807.1 ABC transporter substrate-binding protein [Agrobacterium leguminum]CVI62604.1 Periplasmic component of amino acid ABC-type transporter/signal transduction system [Agrobacterium deltaense NCPPB 1641]
MALSLSRRMIARALLAGSIMASASIANAFELAEQGKLTVAFTGDMPGSGWQDGKLIGYDGEIMQRIADKLGLKVQPALMEWSGTIASVQSGRVDVMLGTMGWTEKRTKIMTLSEPIHYFKNGIMQPNKTNWDKLSDLEGKKVGTITGFSFVPELKKIKGLELSLYDTSDAAVRDLIAGRIDAVIGDPPVVSYAIKQNPDWNMHFLAFADSSSDYPLLTGLGQVVYGLNQKNDDLRQKMDAVIDEMWKTCEMKAIGDRYGLSADVWFKPVGENFRAGVDRPADYKLPSCTAGG